MRSKGWIYGVGMRSKKGSYTVFITIAFAAVLIMVAGVLWAAGEQAIGATTENFGRLWGRSILAEYDINLKERYGIFGYYGNESSVSEKLDYYADYTFGSKDYIDYGGADCRMEEYRLTDKDVFRSQIKEVVLSLTVPKPIEKSQKGNSGDGGIGPVSGDGGIGTGTGSGNSPGTGNRPGSGNRKITAKWIINGLPSEGKGGGIGIFSLVERIKEGISFSSLLSEAAETAYIFKFFKDHVNDRDLGDTYFSNEVEYIISGKLDDEKGRKHIYNNLIILRNALNLTYLYTCTEKRNAVISAAEMLTPGPAAVITQGLIMEAWAYFEARNDLKALYSGDPVPLLKRDDTWAITLENVINAVFSTDDEGQVVVNPYKEDEDEGGGGGGTGDRDDTGGRGKGQDNRGGRGKGRDNRNNNYVKPLRSEGIKYEDYLKILLTAIPENLKVLRIMDLIQINMKYLYCDYFLMADYYTGLNFNVKVNGREYEFKEEY